MKPDDDALLDCSDVRGELAALAYDDLEPGPRRAAERHLAACAACREALARLEGARARLDRWTEPGRHPAFAPVPAPRRAELLAGVAAASPPRSGRRARPILWSVAAGLLAFVLLAASSARAELASGRLVLTLTAPWSSAPAADRADALPAELLAELAALRDADLRAGAERARLIAFVEEARAADRRALSALLDELALGAAREDQRTRRALGELATLVVHAPPR